MDLKSVREAAIEATNRFFWDKQGYVPDEDSEEWEAEYRRQFDAAKARLATGRPAAPALPASAAKTADPALPELSGSPEQKRWAAAIRAERLAEIRDPQIRAWLTGSWTKAKSWIDTSNLATPVFLERMRPHFQEHRRRQAAQAEAQAAERQRLTAEANARRAEVEAAGITVAGLIELIDAAERLPPGPIKAKLAELDSGERNLRIFETGDELVLTVLEKSGGERSEYGIERDEGLAADLRLYARAGQTPL